MLLIHVEHVAYPHIADVRRCGTVLFHGYGASPYDDLTRFVDSLTKGTIVRDPSFVWWGAR